MISIAYECRDIVLLGDTSHVNAPRILLDGRVLIVDPDNARRTYEWLRSVIDLNEQRKQRTLSALRLSFETVSAPPNGLEGPAYGILRVSESDGTIIATSSAPEMPLVGRKIDL